MLEGKIEGKLVIPDDRYDLARASLALTKLALEEIEVVTPRTLKRALEEAENLISCEDCVQEDDICRSILDSCVRRGKMRLIKLIDQVSEIASNAIYSIYHEELHIPHLSPIRRAKRLKGLAMKLAEVAFRQKFYLRERGIEILYRRMYIGIPDLVRCINMLPVRFDIKLQDDTVHVLVEFPERIFGNVAKRIIKRLLTPKGLLIQSMDLAAQLTLIKRIKKKLKEKGVRDVLDIVGVFADRFLRKIARRDLMDMLEKWLHEAKLDDQVTIVFFDKNGRLKVFGKDSERFEYLVVRYTPKEIVAMIPGLDIIAGDRVYIFWHTENV